MTTKYKLKFPDSSWVDIYHPSQQSLGPGEVKELIKTPGMLERLAAGGIVIANEDDIKRYNAVLEIRRIRAELIKLSRDGVDFLEIILKRDDLRKNRVYSERYFKNEQQEAEKSFFIESDFYNTCLLVTSHIHDIVDLRDIAELPKESSYNLDHQSLNEIEGFIKSVFQKPISSNSFSSLLKESSLHIIPIIQKEYARCSEQRKVAMLFALFKLDHLDFNPINNKGKGRQTNDLLNELLSTDGSRQSYTHWAKRLSELFAPGNNEFKKTVDKNDKKLLQDEILRLNEILGK